MCLNIMLKIGKINVLYLNRFSRPIETNMNFIFFLNKHKMYNTLLKARALVAYRGSSQVIEGVRQFGGTCWIAAAIFLMKENTLLSQKMHNIVKDYVERYINDAPKALGTATHGYFTRDSQNCKTIPEEISREYLRLSKEPGKYIRSDIGGWCIDFLQACASLSGWYFERVIHEFPPDVFGSPYVNESLQSPETNVHVEVSLKDGEFDLFEEDSIEESGVSIINQPRLYTILEQVKNLSYVQNKTCVGCFVYVQHYNRISGDEDGHVMGCLYKNDDFILCQSWYGTGCVNVRDLNTNKVNNKEKLGLDDHGLSVKVYKIDVLFVSNV